MYVVTGAMDVQMKISRLTEHCEDVSPRVVCDFTVAM